MANDFYHGVPEKALTRFWVLYPYTVRVGGSDPGFGIAYADKGNLFQFCSGMTWDRATQRIRAHNRRLNKQRQQRP